MNEEKDGNKFHRRVDELICNWSMMTMHSFKEEEINSLVDLIADDFKKQAKEIFSVGVKTGKTLAGITKGSGG